SAGGGGGGGGVGGARGARRGDGVPDRRRQRVHGRVVDGQDRDVVADLVANELGHGAHLDDHVGRGSVRVELATSIDDAPLGRGDAAADVDALRDAADLADVAQDGAEQRHLEVDGGEGAAGRHHRVHGGAERGVEQRRGEAAVDRAEAGGVGRGRLRGEDGAARR